MTPREAVSDVLVVASGRVDHPEPVLPRTGGPAGNAQLTARLGLALLALFVAELVTLVDIRGLITWHLAVGLLLVPPALVKIATTGWRILRYYAGAAAYHEAGPPPLLLRLLGPLVIVGTLALLGTGVALIVVGEQTGRQPLLTVLGQDISPLSLHQASFVLWGVATGLHVLGRLLPAARLATTTTAGGRRVPGAGGRATALVVTAAAAVLVAAVVLGLGSSWTSDGGGGRDAGVRHELGVSSARPAR